MIMSPFCPCLDEVFVDKFTKGFTVVGNHFHITVNKFIYVVLKTIAPAFLELREDVWCIVCPTNLVGIVEEGVWVWRVGIVEGIAYMLEIV